MDLTFEASPEAEAELRWVRETLRAREFGDEQRLRQVLMNLVSNGDSAHPAGGAVRVTVASAVAVSVRIEDDTSASSRLGRRSHRRSSHRSSNDSNASSLNDASPGQNDAGGSQERPSTT